MEAERERLEQLIRSVKDTIGAEERNEIMSDEQKFEAFKRRTVTHNEEVYGAEIRTKYGDQEVDEANAAVRNLTQKQYQEWTDLGREIQERLEAAVQAGLSPGRSRGQGDHRPPPPVAHHYREAVRPGQTPGDRGALCDGRAVHRLLRQTSARLRPLPAGMPWLIG